MKKSNQIIVNKNHFRIKTIWKSVSYNTLISREMRRSRKSNWNKFLIKESKKIIVNEMILCYSFLITNISCLQIFYNIHCDCYLISCYHFYFWCQIYRLLGHEDLAALGQKITPSVTFSTIIYLDIFLPEYQIKFQD